MLVAFVFDAQLFSNCGNSLISFEKSDYYLPTTNYGLHSLRHPYPQQSHRRSDHVGGHFGQLKA